MNIFNEDLQAEMKKLQEAEVLVVGDKKYIEYDMIIEFTKRLIKSQREEAVREFVRWFVARELREQEAQAVKEMSFITFDNQHLVKLEKSVDDFLKDASDETTEDTTGVLPKNKAGDTTDGGVVFISPSSDETTEERSGSSTSIKSSPSTSSEASSSTSMDNSETSEDKWRTQGYVEGGENDNN